MRRRLFIISLSLLLAIAIGFAFIVYTESGLRWVLNQAGNNVPGSLSFNSVSGRLTGPMELKGFSYSEDNISIAAHSISLDWEPLQLLSLHFHITDFNASGVTLETTDSSDPPKESEGIPDIRLPLGITVDNLLIRDVSLVEKGGSSPLTIKEIILKADMNKTDITIDRLSVISSESAFTLGGTVKLDALHTMNLQTQWHIMSEGYAEITGSGELKGDLNILRVRQNIQDPFTAQLEADVFDVMKEMNWKANIMIDGLSLHTVHNKWPAVDIHGNLNSTGTVASFDVKGTIDMYEKEYGKVVTDLSISKGSDIWFIKHARLSSPETEALVELSGQYVQADEKMSFQIEGKWDDIGWPLSAKEPDVISRKGTFKINGTPDTYDVSLAAEMTGKQFPPGNIRLSGKGTQEKVAIETISADFLDGTLTGQSTITWEPFLSWQASLYGKSINPGVYRPEWPGRLDMTLRAQGSASKGTHYLRIDDSSVQGVLRGYPFQAEAEFTMADNVYSLPIFELTSGSAHLKASGSYSGQWDGQWSIKAPALGDLLEGGKGEIYGEGTVGGEGNSPKVKAQAQGSGLSLGSYQAEQLKLDVNVDISDRDVSHIDISGEELFINALEIQSFNLKASGELSSHTLSFSAVSPKISIGFSADAGLKNETWQGSLTDGEVNLYDFGNWTLSKPAIFSLSETAVHTDDLCLLWDSSSACLQTEWVDKEGLSGQASLSEIPLSLLNTVISSDASLDGALNGKAEMSYSKNNLNGRVAIDIPRGMISYKINREDSFTVPIEQASMSASIFNDGLDLKLDMPLKERGHIQGSFHLPQFSPLKGIQKDQVLAGNILGDFNALDIVPLFTSHIADTKGIIKADVTLGGTFGHPELTGQVSLHEGKASIPDLGIHLSNMRLDVKAGQNRTLIVDSNVKSGEGSLRIGGEILLNEPEVLTASLSLKGENVEAVRTPELHITASPDLEITIHDRSIDIQGTLSVPEAEIEPPDLAGAVPVSKDVYIMSDTVPKKSEEEWKIKSRIKLILGDKVAFTGFGLSSRITGSISVTEEPGKATRAAGELEMLDGIYKAYGQDLTIQKGRFLFVDLIDDPGLDVKAVRQIKDVLAGVQVSGTLMAPDMRVFSVPAMDQGDALSYLLLGRPMNQLSSSEGGQLHDAALSAGLSGGGFLAKKIGAAFGLEEVELEKGETLEESSLIIGKYLSPRLYVSYGIGLFEPINTLRMRYNLSRRWLLQTEYGIESGGDVMYKLER